MAETYWVCGKCDKVCESTETETVDHESFWGAPVRRVGYETSSSCCKDDCYTVEEWLENGWSLPDLPKVDLIEYGFIRSKLL